MKRSAWIKDNMKIKRLEYLYSKRIMTHDTYTLQGHQRAIRTEARIMVQKYQETGVLDI